MRVGLFAHNEASQDKLQNLPGLGLCLNGRAVKDLHKTRSPLNKIIKNIYIYMWCGLQQHTTLQYESPSETTAAPFLGKNAHLRTKRTAKGSIGAEMPFSNSPTKTKLRIGSKIRVGWFKQR
jgi:hypothetical protein